MRGYLRSNDLWQELTLQKRTRIRSGNSYKDTYSGTDTAKFVVTAASAGASNIRRMGGGLERSVTHELVQRGAPKLDVGDRVVAKDGTEFYIQYRNNPGMLDHYTIYFAEQRNVGEDA